MITNSLQTAVHGAVLSLVLAVPPTAAQEALPGAKLLNPARPTSVLEEVQVIARRRAETLQDIPLAASAFRGDFLETTGTVNVERLQQLEPSLQFVSSNPRNSAITIRGLGAPFGLTNDGIEQGVGLYIDDVYYARAAASTFDLLDVEQLEMLRGPQGTLYGKNTTAGAINISTRKPTFTREGNIDVTSGNFDYLQTRGVFSGPLSDTLAGRVALSRTRRDGLLENVFNGDDVNTIDNTDTRAQLLWRPNDRLDLYLSADYSRQDPGCCGLVFVRSHPNLRPTERRFDALASTSGYQVASENPFDRKLDADTALQARQSFGGGSLRAIWETDLGTVTAVTAWRFWDWSPSNDRDFTGLPITTVSANPSQQRQWTQELRFASGNGGAIDYVAGLFAFHQRIDSDGLQEQGSAASLWLLGPEVGTDPALLDGLRRDTDIDYENTSLAAFGQLTWHVSDRLRIEPGLRINYDEKTADYKAIASGGLETDDQTLIALKNRVLNSQSYSADFDDLDWAFDITASYDIGSSTLGYATLARNFKSGGVNLSGIPNGPDGMPNTQLGTVDPETVYHMELGLKTTLLDGRATLNLALFRTDVEDFQATVVDGSVGTLRGFLANAPEVRSQGVELDFNFAPSLSWRYHANLAYTDAEYLDFPSAPPPPELAGGQVSSVDVSGQRLPGLSDWSLSYGVEYHRALSATGYAGELFVDLQGLYRSEWSSNPTPSDFMMVDGYNLLDLRAGLRGGEHWEAWAWMRNASDEDYFNFLRQASGSLGLVVGQPGDPRSYGVTLRYRF